MRALTLFAAGLAFVAVVMGAYVRLSNAGLGCPDWPGCYGHPTPALASHEIKAALAADPGGPVSTTKAWKEMIHRYLAGTLGLTIFALALRAWLSLPPGRRLLPTVLAVLVVAQALLGMWTVTLRLMPVVVTGHLIGGMTTLGLLAWLLLSDAAHAHPARASLRPTALALLCLLATQIVLGGWVSANYAALACPDLPTCRGSLWPAMDIRAAFDLEQLPGALPDSALVAIQVVHRLGALAVAVGTLWLAHRLRAVPGMARPAWILIAALGAQLLLGAGNILFGLPLPVAVAHNAGAASLLVAVVWINARLRMAPP